MTNYIIYFDEVKSNPSNGQLRYTIGGVAAPINLIRSIENHMNQISESFFGDLELKPETEFHASYIYYGKGPYKGCDVRERLDLLRNLTEIINAYEEGGLRRVYASIHTDRLHAGADAAQIAFTFFCERAQMLTSRKGHSILIGDHDNEQSRKMIRDFSKFRSNGTTPWAYGTPIPNIVDAVHFAHSHHSRMIQLADIYLFALSHGWGSRKGWAADQLSERLRGIDLWGHRYKEWPSS